MSEIETTKVYEKSIMDGICPDCEGPIKTWTQEEINAVKEDLGMSDDEDFMDVCEECVKNYQYL